MPFSQSRQNTRPKRRHLKSYVIMLMFLFRLKKSKKKSQHRNYVLKEWWDTEKSYHRNLKAALDVVKKSMLERNVATQSETSILFPQFEGMLQLSKKMMQTIEFARGQSNHNRILIGDKLKHFASFYKLYASYFGCRAKSQNLLSEIEMKKEGQLKQIERELREHMKKVDPRKQLMTISDCLAQPQYRIFKYCLLLKDYIKNLPSNHKDYQPLNEALVTYNSINESNNKLMGTLEAEEKKTKLDKLCGKAIDTSSKYIIEMAAQTIFFSAKLYIFTNLVIVTKKEKMIGSRDQKHYLNIQLNEFSFLILKKDKKYFSNILLLCGANECFHFHFSDQGPCYEVRSILQNKVLLPLKERGYQRRRLEENLVKEKKKVQFLLQEKQSLIYYPQFRIQVLNVDLRPFSRFTNDTVYISVFALPEYYEDAKVLGLRAGQEESVDNGSQRHTLGQQIEIHLSQVLQIYKDLKEQFPQIEFPEIDPLTKDINAYKTNKKSTKAYELRLFLFQQFLNFAFRHPAIMRNPIWLIQRLRLEPNLWGYALERNQAMTDPQLFKKSMGYEHCASCLKGNIKSLEEFQHYRRFFQSTQDKERFCFNFYSILREKILNFDFMSFNTLERMLYYVHYVKGRLDYSFLIERPSPSKKVSVLRIYISDQLRGKDKDKFFQARIHPITKVGQIINSFCKETDSPCFFDYRLVLRYNDKLRILDQDQFIQDVVKKYNIPTMEVEGDVDRSSMSTVPIQEQQQGGSLLMAMKEFFSKSQNKICFMKMIYLPYELESKSVNNFPIKGLMVVSDLLQKLYLEEIQLQTVHLAQIFAYVQAYFQKLAILQHLRSSSQIIHQLRQFLLKQSKYSCTQHNKFISQLENCIQEIKKEFRKIPPSDNSNSKMQKYCMKQILRIFYKYQKAYTFLVPAACKNIPAKLINPLANKFNCSSCLLGVNYKQFLVYDVQYNKQPILRLNINDIQPTLTVFSLFITYTGCSSNSSHNYSQEQDSKLRFDSQMLYHFVELLQIYQELGKKFPGHVAQSTLK